MRKEVKILGLSYSQSQIGSYVIVLSEKKGKRKIPIIIKQNDAQQIALKLEDMTTHRPLTNDLFKSMTDFFMIDISEFYIYQILEGIFYAKLIATNGIEDVELECSIGDGLSLATTYGCPIYVSEEILETSGVEINDDGSGHEPTDSEVDEEDDDKPTRLSIEDLEHMMQDAIDNEEYEIAAEIRDRISKLKN